MKTMNASMTTAIVASHLIWLVGCSPSDPDSVTDRDQDEVCNEEMQAASPRRDFSKEELARITEIDVTFATWYSHQMLAASQIERHEGVQFGPITFERDPQVIITEQRRNIPLVEGLHESQRDELKKSIVFWHEQQIEAANCLRDTLGKEKITSGDERDFTSVLHQQEKDIVALKKESKEILGYEYWPSRAASDRGGTN